MKLLAALALLAISLTACGGGESASGIDATSTIASAVVTGGNNQTGPVGTTLPVPLRTQMLNSSGRPMAGQLVNFVVIAGGGEVFAPAVETDRNGVASQAWTLGRVPGINSVDVRAMSSSGTAVVYATFMATAVAGPPQSASKASGDGQGGTQLQPLASPVVVVVRDAFGNAVPGVAVTFSAGNAGSASPASMVSDAAGAATAVWTLGPAIGAQTLVAVADGLTALTFSATAARAPPQAATTLTRVSGDAQTFAQHALPPQPLSVRVTDVLGNPVPGVPVTFSTSTGAGATVPTVVNADGSGLAAWSGYFHVAGPQTVTAAASGTTAVTFVANIIASAYPYDGRYSCQRISATCNPAGFVLLDGLVQNDGNFGTTGGSVNPATGALTITFSFGVGGVVNASSPLTISASQDAAGVGIINQAFGSICSQNVGSRWTCSRQ